MGEETVEQPSPDPDPDPSPDPGPDPDPDPDPTPDQVEQVLRVLAASPHVKTVDITGGAPEMSPAFWPLVRGARTLGLEARLHLPVSPYISMYLPISPCISL